MSQENVIKLWVALSFLTRRAFEGFLSRAHGKVYQAALMKKIVHRGAQILPASGLLFLSQCFRN